MSEIPVKIAVLGGTGAQGRGLALRWAAAGHPVILGSRDPEKGQAAAEVILQRLPKATVSTATYAEAARDADVVVLALPYSAQSEAAAAIGPMVAGKIVVDVTVPLVPPRVSQVSLPQGGSAAQGLQALVGPDAKVVSAFQNVSATHLDHLDHPIDCDVLICGDDGDACDIVVGLAKDAGMRGLRAGPLSNAVVAEALTAVLIGMNRRYKSAGAGIKITGLPE